VHGRRFPYRSDRKPGRAQGHPRARWGRWVRHGPCRARVRGATGGCGCPPLFGSCSEHEACAPSPRSRITRRSRGWRPNGSDPPPPVVQIRMRAVRIALRAAGRCAEPHAFTRGGRGTPGGPARGHQGIIRRVALAHGVGSGARARRSGPRSPSPRGGPRSPGSACPCRRCARPRDQGRRRGDGRVGILIRRGSSERAWSGRKTVSHRATRWTLRSNCIGGRPLARVPSTTRLAPAPLDRPDPHPRVPGGERGEGPIGTACASPGSEEVSQ